MYHSSPFAWTVRVCQHVSAVQCIRKIRWSRRVWPIINTNREEPTMPRCLSKQCISELLLLEPMRTKQVRENPNEKVQSCSEHGTIVYWTWLIASRSSKRNQSLNRNDIVIWWTIRKNVDRNLDHVVQSREFHPKKNACFRTSDVPRSTSKYWGVPTRSWLIRAWTMSLKVSRATDEPGM